MREKEEMSLNLIHFFNHIRQECLITQLLDRLWINLSNVLATKYQLIYHYTSTYYTNIDIPSKNSVSVRPYNVTQWSFYAKENGCCKCIEMVHYAPNNSYNQRINRTMIIKTLSIKADFFLQLIMHIICMQLHFSFYWRVRGYMRWSCYYLCTQQSVGY